jgi:hypothetical protein
VKNRSRRGLESKCRLFLCTHACKWIRQRERWSDWDAFRRPTVVMTYSRTYSWTTGTSGNPETSNEVDFWEHMTDSEMSTVVLQVRDGIIERTTLIAHLSISSVVQWRH